MTRLLPVVAATVPAAALLALGFHGWQGLRDVERIRRRLGLTEPARGRWGRTEALVRRVPGAAALGRRADAAGGRVGVVDVLLLWAVLWYPLSRAAASALGGKAGPVVVAVALPVVTWTALDALARRRRERVISQLPDLVRHLAGGARAGLSLSGSLRHAAHDVGEPTATELRRVVAAIELGTLPATALEQLAARLGSPDLDVLTSALVIQQRSGGDLVALLSQLAEGLESMRRARREIRAITAGPGAQAYMALLLGLGGAALSNQVTDGGLDRALGKPLPAVIFTVSVLVLVVAIVVIRRIVRITS